MRREGALDEFYGLLGELAMATGGPRLLRECSAQSGWPARGVYFFFEDGETRGDGVTARVTRVGTHALRPSKSTLWKRLSQHRGSTGGSLPGGGNHRGSIFRLHVGTALASAKQPMFDSEFGTWGRGTKADPVVRAQEHELELAVSAYIGAMPFLWLEVDDEPGSGSDRGIIESGAIGLLSNFDRVPIDPPSSEWLGNHADRDAVRRSGLWNVNHITQAPDPAFLATMRRWVDEVAR